MAIQYNSGYGESSGGGINDMMAAGDGRGGKLIGWDVVSLWFLVSIDCVCCVLSEMIE